MRWRVLINICRGGDFDPAFHCPCGTNLAAAISRYLPEDQRCGASGKAGRFRARWTISRTVTRSWRRSTRSDPNWETALVVHRMEDCQAKILELQPKADAQVARLLPRRSVGPGPPTPSTNRRLKPLRASRVTQTPSNDDEVNVAAAAIEGGEGRIDGSPRKSCRTSQAQLETYRTQLETVNSNWPR